MAYLTEEEVTELLNDGKTQEYIDAAVLVLDSVTQHFYRWNDYSSDHLFRREQFKKALLSQINYFSELGTVSFNEIDSMPNNFSVGRTSISNGDSKGSGTSRSYVAPNVIMLLEGTGLLYRGGSIWG